MITSFRVAKTHIKCDYEKINGKATAFGIFKSLLFEPGFKFIFWLRLTQFFWVKRRSIRFPLFIICRMIYKHFSYKYGFEISYKTEIGEGFSISHFGYVIIGGNVKIGKNCWVRPGLCIGKKHIDSHSQGPVIGDNVKIGVGATILGDITIGDNVSIGANSVVVKDVPDNCVVAGVPGKVINRIQ